MRGDHIVKNLCHTDDPKAQLYWGLRQRFQDGDVAGLTDELTISQLASIRYKHNARGQVIIESKEVARKRGVKSPDRAEAPMLAFADRTPGIMWFYEDQYNQAVAGPQNKPQPRPPREEMGLEGEDDDEERPDDDLPQGARAAGKRAAKTMTMPIPALCAN